MVLLYKAIWVVDDTADVVVENCLCTVNTNTNGLLSDG